MKLEGYRVQDVVPSEMASGAKAITCKEAHCAASTTMTRPAGEYNIAVGYYDYHDGASLFSLALNGKQIGQWTASDNLPMNNISGTTATRWANWAPLYLKPGDTLRLTATPQGGEPAPVDYLELSPAVQPLRKTP